MRQQTVILLLTSVAYALGIPLSGEDTLVITTENTSDGKVTTAEPTTETPLEPIKIYSMKVISEVSARYAHTVVSSRVANPANKAQEVTFSVLLPETAFISGFLMDLDGKVYEAYVKEKEDAKRIYQEAVNSGIAAAHVVATARDSNHFTVTVNVEPNSKGTFNLTYEELLTRRLGVYNDVINLNPGQIVKDLSVTVHITENRPINVLRVPVLRSGNEIEVGEETKENKYAEIKQSDNLKKATIRFSPTAEQQIELRNVFREKLRAEREKNKDYYYNPWSNPTENSEKDTDGLNGQFVVQYDVERDPHNGEVLVYDGYFAHFFAPTDLKPLNKHVVFVLDVSGSMYGRKIEQLKEAMLSILDNLHTGDYFSIIEFDTTVKVYDLDNLNNSVIYGFEQQTWNRPYEGESVYKRNGPAPLPSEVTPEYIAKAKKIINELIVKDSTNIVDALKTAVQVTQYGVRPVAVERHVQNIDSSKPTDNDGENAVKIDLKDYANIVKPVSPKPMIIFLTDGDANVGESESDKIISAIDELNTGDKKAAIFSLAFGESADRYLLQKLSLNNDGFLRHIYEAADSVQQLKNFYQEVSSPLLAGIKFVYPPDQVEEESVTKDNFHILFNGGEIVVAGKLKNSNVQELTPTVSAISQSGSIDFAPKVINDDDPKISDSEKPKKRFEPTERLWAYLHIKQLLDLVDGKTAKTTITTTTEKGTIKDEEAKTEETPKQKALALALKYSFVTPLTSLVVVKPNDTSAVNAEAADKTSGGPGGYLSTPYSASGFAPGTSVYGGANFGGALNGQPGAAAFIPVAQYDSIPIRVSANKEALYEEVVTTIIPETTQITEAELYGLEKYPWLEQYIVEHLGQLEIPINNTTVVLKLEADKSKLSADDPPCGNTESGEAGVCKYITSCLTSMKALENLDSYSKYYCSRHGYAGVCCSKNS